MDDNTNDEEDGQPKVMTHMEATASLDKLLSFVERQSDTTRAEFLVMTNA